MGLQTLHRIRVRLIQQFQQDMLDFDIKIGLLHTQLGRPFQRLFTGGVQLPHKGFHIQLHARGAPSRSTDKTPSRFEISRKGRDSDMRNRNAYTVIPTRAGIQHHPRESRPPLWTPDQVRGDGALSKCLLTLRSEASRRVGPLKAPYLQPLLRDGALAPHQDENGTI